MLRLLFLFTALFCSSALARPVGRACVRSYLVKLINAPVKTKSLQPGQKVMLQGPHFSAPTQAVFLARIVNPEDAVETLAFYDSRFQDIFLLPARDTQTLHQGRVLDPSRSLSVVQTRTQLGRTCAAFSLYNCFLQIETLGYHSPLKSIGTAREEQNRFISRLVSVASKLERWDWQRDRIENYLKGKAIQNRRILRSDLGSAEAVLNHLAQNKPVLIHYAGLEKADGYTRHELGKAVRASQRTLRPDPIADQARHAVLATHSIRMPDGSTKVFVWDSHTKDFTLWDAKEFEPRNGNTEIDEYFMIEPGSNGSYGRDR